MNEAFVRDHLGEPWAKQDPFTTGSGLSVHLAYRVIDLMGGHMEISSAPGRGCVVNLEVPVLRRSPLIPLTPVPTTSLDPNVIAPTPPSEPKQRKIALVGFNRSDKKQSGLPELGETLKRQYAKLGCEIVSIPDADLIIANGDVEEMENRRDHLPRSAGTRTQPRRAGRGEAVLEKRQADPQARHAIRHPPDSRPSSDSCRFPNSAGTAAT
jgi:hypothetical protein